MVFALALGMVNARRQTSYRHMKRPIPSTWLRSGCRILCSLACLFPSLLLAHPGHFHPDETDEFDFIRATLMHSHGSLDLVIGAVAVISIGMVCIHGNRRIRIAAGLVALGSLALASLT